MKKQYRIEWYYSDGILRTHSEDLVRIAESKWYDSYRNCTHKNPEEWFQAIKQDYWEPGDIEPKLLERTIEDWAPTTKAKATCRLRIADGLRVPITRNSAAQLLRTNRTNPNVKINIDPIGWGGKTPVRSYYSILMSNAGLEMKFSLERDFTGDFDY